MEDSDINRKLSILSEGLHKQYKAYCDGIFPVFYCQFSCDSFKIHISENFDCELMVRIT